MQCFVNRHKETQGKHTGMAVKFGTEKYQIYGNVNFQQPTS